MKRVKVGDVFNFTGAYVENPDPPPVLQVGDIVSMASPDGEVDYYYRVVEDSAVGGTLAWRLSGPYRDAACTILADVVVVASAQGDGAGE